MATVVEDTREDTWIFEPLRYYSKYKRDKVVLLLKVKYLIIRSWLSYQDLYVLWEDLDIYVKV